MVIWERPRAVYDTNIEKYSITYRLAKAEDSVVSEYLTDGYQDTVSNYPKVNKTDKKKLETKAH